jgi:AmmeMemoRadiSam system protein B
MSLRLPALAGRLYPSDPIRLRDLVQSYLAGADPPRTQRPPKALIVPHAGYIYSGPVAGAGYAWLAPWSSTFERVVILGTCHTPGVRGLAASSAAAFLSPLGRVTVDRAAVEQSLEFPQVRIDDGAQNRDHALEVQLSFLQILLGSFTIVPYLVGRADACDVASVLEALWGDAHTLILVSSDLSHDLPYEEARDADRATAQAIEHLECERLGPGSACGRNAIAGLLHAARQHDLICHRVDLRSSGDTAGARDRVVGYGSWVFVPAGSS